MVCVNGTAWEPVLRINRSKVQPRPTSAKSTSQTSTVALPPALSPAQERTDASCKMPSSTFYRSYSKTFKKPRRPFEKERLDNELKTVGEFGLRNKRELWRVQFALNKLRNAARVLLTLDEKDPKRIFEGEAIMRRMYRYGLLVRHPPSRAVVFTAVERSDAARRRASARPRARFSLGFRLQSSCRASSHRPIPPLLCSSRTRPRTSSITSSRSPRMRSSSAVSRRSCSSLASRSRCTTRACSFARGTFASASRS
mmetsp:Transcript_14684/g.52849  ORF Transcript_14684/g.52849 Transcript_14684/m.52849 type:complete len:255 (-) Transcript_14684:260-1024(-)